MAFAFDKEYGVALITGAGSGIGRELAVQLAAHGVAIAGIDRDETGLRWLEAELSKTGKKIAWELADVTDATLLDGKTRLLEEKLGPVDLLIASAGVGYETSALSLEAADVAKVINVNLTGVSNSIAAVLPGMLKRRKGHLVALSSLASIRGLPRMLGYCASKSGLNALMEGLRVETSPHGVTSTIVCPGWIRTPMTASLVAPMKGIMDVDYAARQILWAIRKKKSYYAFPRSLVWRLKFITWLPRSWQDKLLRSMVGRR